jgi:hypothetical protein
VHYLHRRMQLFVIGSIHHHAGEANEGQNAKQHQFGHIVHQAVKDISIYWTPGDQRTPPLASKLSEQLCINGDNLTLN